MNDEKPNTAITGIRDADFNSIIGVKETIIYDADFNCIVDIVESRYPGEPELYEGIVDRETTDLFDTSGGAVSLCPRPLTEEERAKIYARAKADDDRMMASMTVRGDGFMTNDDDVPF
jgi:hypothetical protein